MAEAPDERDRLVAAARRALDARREELRARVAAENLETRPVSLDEPIGRLSRMDAMQQQAMAQAQARLAAQELTRVEAALRRIDEGTYGECVECGEMIAPGRLRVMPDVLLCIACAEKA